MGFACRVGLLSAADAALLTALWPDWPALTHDLAAPTDWVERVGLDGAAGVLAAAALWLTAAWLALGLCASVLAGAPGATGRMADQLARAVLPRALYRAAAAAVGLGVVLTPVAAGAYAPARQVPAPGRSAIGVSAPSPGAPSATLPAPVLPSSPSSPSSPSRPPAHPPARHPSPPSSPSPPPPPPQSPPPAGSGQQVLVRPGDSLWRIAAQHLPPDAPPAAIARAWPRWYATNRAVIGADPNRIMPGQELHAPAHAASTTSTPTTQEP